MGHSPSQQGPSRLPPCCVVFSGSTSYVPAAGADTRAAIWSRSDLRAVGPFATACGSVDPHFERLPVARTSLDAAEGGD